MKKLSMVIPLVCLLCFIFSCQQQPAEETEEQLTHEEAKALLDNVLLIMNEGRLDLIEKHYAPDLILKTSSMLQTSKGYEGLRTWLNNVSTSVPDQYITFNEIYVDGNVIFTRWTGTGTNTGPLGEIPATGRSFSNSGLSFYRIENGLISEMEVVFNMLDTMQQLGFTLTPPKLPEQPEAKK
jgi:steroid delta-isomerase-like uncharacterized protein